MLWVDIFYADNSHLASTPHLFTQTKPLKFHGKNIHMYVDHVCYLSWVCLNDLLPPCWTRQSKEEGEKKRHLWCVHPVWRLSSIAVCWWDLSESVDSLALCRHTLPSFTTKTLILPTHFPDIRSCFKQSKQSSVYTDANDERKEKPAKWRLKWVKCQLFPITHDWWAWCKHAFPVTVHVLLSN